MLGTEQYRYDPLGRLVSHLNPEQRFKHYLNDPAGDRLGTRIHQPPGDEEQAPEWRREGEYEGTHYRFDCAGNLVDRQGPQGDTCFRWDANQRLIESDTDGKLTRYYYDCLGRRISKETDGVITRFFWDGDALLGDVLVEAESNEAAASRLREWLYYPETFEPLAMMQNEGASESALYLYHNDPNGCPTRLLDAQGSVVWAAKYSAWGGIEKLLVDRVDNPLRLQGQYGDGETGFYYNRYRYYDADVGQFVSQDPIGLAGGVNNYQYGLNTAGWVDPLGLNCQSLSRGAVSRRARWVKAVQGLEGPGLTGHFRKHGDQVGASSRRSYDLSARNTIREGRRFTYKDRMTGARRVGYWNPETSLFTATSQTRKVPAILTHFPETWSNLRSLPGFSTG